MFELRDRFTRSRHVTLTLSCFISFNSEYSEKGVSYQHQEPEDDLNRSHVLPRDEPPPPYSAPIPPPAAYANRNSQPAYPFYTANYRFVQCLMR